MTRNSFALHLLAVWKQISFHTLLPSSFCKTGIYPFSPEQLKSFEPNKNTEPQLSANEAQLLSVRNSPREHGVADAVIERTLEDMLLTKRNRSRSDVFAAELASLILKKGDLAAKKLVVDSRLSSKELGQILLEKEFKASKSSRVKTAREKAKSSKQKKPVKEALVNNKPPAKRGRPKKL